MNLTSDEIKVLLTILNQLQYSLKDASVIAPIVVKLNKMIEEPTLEATNKVEAEDGTIIN